MQLAIAVLFADLVLAWRTGKGLSHWSIQADILLANSGFLLIFILCFGLLMSVVMPLAAELCRQIGWYLLINVPFPDWMRAERDYRRPAGGVLVGELKEYAYRTEDRELLAMAHAHQEKIRRNISENIASGQLMFSVLTLGLVNYFPAIVNIRAHTLLQEFVATFDYFGEMTLAFAFLMSIVAIKESWFSMRTFNWIDYPPLHEQIERAHREQRSID